jgi:hypothetical protein
MTPTPLEAARETCLKIEENIAKVMRGQAGLTRQMLAALAGAAAGTGGETGRARQPKSISTPARLAATASAGIRRAGVGQR